MMGCEPKEWGFLFKVPLALAVHNGTKTETRRLPGPRLFSVDGGPWPKGWTFDLAGARLDNGPSPVGNAGPYLVAKRIGADTEHRLYPRIQVGHRIWAKETWAWSGDRGIPEAERLARGEVWYRADRERGPAIRWRPSILMPRWAARSVREVVSVGLERLQDITEQAALAEGLERRAATENPEIAVYGLDGWSAWFDDPRTAFRVGWNDINGDRAGATWETDPPVLVIGWLASVETSGRAA